VHQVYRQPPAGKLVPLAAGRTVDPSAVASYLGDLPEVKGGKLGLRPKLVTHIPGPAGAGAVKAEARKLTYCSFTLLYKTVPVAKASRGVLLDAGRPVFVRERNCPAAGADLGPTES